jgi:hypothetical protein
MISKKILVNASPGSGNTFCKTLIAENLGVTVIWQNHEIGAFREWPDAVFILRDPYDSIASAVEIIIHNLSDKEFEYYQAHKESRQNHKIIENIKNYELMLNALKEFPLVKVVTFEFLTNQPEEFLNSIAKRFNLEFLQERRPPYELLNRMKNANMPRAPRGKTAERKEIDRMVRNNEHMPQLYEKYLKLKEIIQLTENSV